MLEGGARFASRPGWLARLLSPGFNTLVDRVDRGFEYGSLTAQLPDGTTRMLGGRRPGFDADIRLHDWRALLRLATNGSIGWYQAYDAGDPAKDSGRMLLILLLVVFLDLVVHSTSLPAAPPSVVA